MKMIIFFQHETGPFNIQAYRHPQCDPILADVIMYLEEYVSDLKYKLADKCMALLDAQGNNQPTVEDYERLMDTIRTFSCIQGTTTTPPPQQPYTLPANDGGPEVATPAPDTYTGTQQHLQRYAITFSYLHTAENDEEAIESAQVFAADMNRLYDCHCTVDAIDEVPFGSTTARKVL